MPAVVSWSLGALLAGAGIALLTRMALRLGDRPWPRPGFGVGDIILCGLFMLWWLLATAENLGKPLTVNTRVLIDNAVFNCCIVAAICGFLTARGKNPIRLFGLRWTEWRGGIPLVGLALGAVAPVIFLAMEVFQTMRGHVDAPQDLLLFLVNAPTWTEKGLLIFTALVVAPVTEEVVFRGYLHGVLRQIGGRWCGIVVNALLFAAVHGHIPSLGGLFLLAVALSLVYERTGSLWAPILLHAGFNTASILVALSWPDLLK